MCTSSATTIWSFFCFHENLDDKKNVPFQPQDSIYMYNIVCNLRIKCFRRVDEIWSRRGNKNTIMTMKKKKKWQFKESCWFSGPIAFALTKEEELCGIYLLLHLATNDCASIIHTERLNLRLFRCNVYNMASPQHMHMGKILNTK